MTIRLFLSREQNTSGSINEVMDMRKWFLLLSAFFLIILSLSACRQQTFEDFGESMTLSVCEEYYHVHEKDLCTQYEIYNKRGEKVLSDVTDRPVAIQMADDNIVDIAISRGAGIWEHTYYHVAKEKFSKTYTYVVAQCADRIVYMDIPRDHPIRDRALKVEDVFDLTTPPMVISLDFSPVIEVIESAELVCQGSVLRIVYLSGEEQSVKFLCIKLDLYPFGMPYPF